MGKGVKVVDDNSKVSIPLLQKYSNKHNEPEPDVVEEKPKKVSIRQLWRYATGPDLIMVFLGILVSTVTGVGMPMMSIVVGDLSNSFIKMTTRLQHPHDICNENTNETWENCYTDDMFKHAVLKNVYYYLILGFAVLIAAFTQVTCFLISGENMIHRMRKAFFKAIMRQDISWFDKNNSGTLTTKLFDNLERVKEGTGDKIGLLIQFLAQFFGGFIIAFSYDWKLTLIMMSLSPLLVCCGLFMAKLMASSAAKEAKQYALAGGIAEQALTSIRTVVAFNGEKHECDRYDAALVQGKNTGVLKSVYIGVGLASTFVVMFSSYCLAFWIGTNFIANGTMEPKTVLTVFFSVMMGSMALGQAGQQFAVLGIAQGAASAIFEIIDRDPEIDSYSDEGKKPDNIRGHIEVSNIEFSYPTRKDIKILEGISFEALPGQTVALVGSSGCGKSTIVQLLLRYYNPDSGRIIIDGHEITDINIHFLRNMIGVVSQEPILFNCSIEENIQYGNDNVTHSELIAACRMANIDKFISNLPNGYKTIVGERGTQLSGGQKQRIAIARALVRNPKILLLDEATSALDAESESVVQQALDKARQGRTTIVIAHRLTTVRNADKIIAMKNGQVFETGTHETLMEKKGLYYDLVNAQVFADVEDATTKLPENRRESIISRRSRTSTVLSARRLSAAFSLEGIGVTPNLDDDEKSVTKRLMKDLLNEGGKEENFTTILKYARPEWSILFFAVTAAAIQGTVFPAFSIFFSKIMEIFATTDIDKMRHDGHFWAIMLLLCGLVQGGTAFIQSSLFGYAAEKLTTRLRTSLFRNIMRMDIAYFDMPNHSSGKISTRLATDTPNIKSAIDFRLGAVIAALVSIVCGLFISFYYNWATSLLVLGIFPLAVVGRSLQLRYLKGSTEKDARDMEKAGNIALQGIENVRTVQSLTLERKFQNMFLECLLGPHKQAKKDAIVQGLTYGFSSSILYFIFAACYRFGLWLILHHNTPPMNIMKVLMAVSFSMGSISFAAAYFPEYKKARLAAGLIFKMLGEEPKIDSLATDGKKCEIKGFVHFKDLQFVYPERPKVKILRGLDISVDPGQTLALVGPSGCGKSTLISLLERFYDPVSGNVVVDGNNLHDLNIEHVRSNMALVSQEPILFDCSIRENIIYGLDPKTVTEDRIYQAAKLANIEKFVTNLPDGYETRVGEKGTQLSGGQKQRIAIARALVRNPKILLLDEATSALDAESESVVQQALDRASEGRTCIIIAHRLSTVVNADCIAVVKDGIILEKGTHSELMAMRGAYFNLTQKQTKHTTFN